MSKRALIVSFALALAGCLFHRGRGEPLYPMNGERPPPERVAQVDGYIRKIDDKRVEENKPYELLPGCHVIETPASWGNVSSSGGVMVDTGNHVFPVLMREGRRYHVDVSVKTMGGSTGSAAIEAVEQDPSGNKTVVYGLGINVATAEACREAEKSPR